MPHRHAQRKGQVIQPSERCLRRWRRLIKRAGEPGFVEAAFDAARAVAPLGYRGADSPFMRLVRMGKDWASLSRDGRAGCVAQAQALAARCAEILDGGDDEGPGERPNARKDIYG